MSKSVPFSAEFCNQTKRGYNDIFKVAISTLLYFLKNSLRLPKCLLILFLPVPSIHYFKEVLQGVEVTLEGDADALCGE